MSKTYFISDLHFNHKNVLIYEPTRIQAMLDYYSNLNEDEIREAYENNDADKIKLILSLHDKMLINKWNSVVKNDDVVWFLGDLGFGNKDYLKECVGQLKGIKKIVMGNHDNLPISWYYDAGFQEVCRHGAILKERFLLTHSPLLGLRCKDGLFNIFGHVHGNPKFETTTLFSRCVCVERTDFLPIRIPEFDNYQPERDIIC